MRPTYHSITRIGIASLLGSLTALAGSPAHADTAAPAPAPSCDPATLQCAVGTVSLRAELPSKLPTTIDSGVMDKGLIKIRTRFTIDPVQGAPLVSIDMPRGAVVQASWNEKGFVNLTPVTERNTTGTIAVRYTLTPSLEASIYGIGINYDAKQLINMLQGANFNYESQKSGPFVPWGFGGGSVEMPAPALDQSTIFALPLSKFGVPSGIVSGSLAIQARAMPTFNYLTKSVLLDSGTVTKADGSAKVAVGDADFLDIGASIAGQVSVTGDLEVRPVVKIDSVDGFPTFGLVKYGFTAVSIPIGAAPVAVAFRTATVHIPLPNVRVPSQAIGLGDVKAGGSATKTITIDNTGEMGGRLEFSSSDPQFVVPKGVVTLASKGKYDLQVSFNPTSSGPASTTITVKSNDPDSPEQSFKIGANGASVGQKDGKDDGDGRLGGDSQDSSGCVIANVGLGSTSNSAALLGLALGLTVVARRRRSA